jgi:hypothetical protein
MDLKKGGVFYFKAFPSLSLLLHQYINSTKLFLLHVRLPPQALGPSKMMF